MKILVTGANGYIGSHVVKQLLDDGHRVVAADISSGNLDPRAEYLSGDLFDGDESIYARLGSPDVCVHLAWRNGFVHNDDSHILDLPAHYTFLKNMIEGGLPHILVMGSMHEIGYWEGAVDENTPCEPLSLYGIAKNTLRQLLFRLTAGKNVCVQWTRGYYITGDDRNNHSIFAKLLEAADAGKTTFPFTSGKNKYDFMTVGELAFQIASVAEQTEVDGIINCCSGRPVSLAERVEAFIRANHLNITLEYGAFPDRAYDSPGIWGDPSKINAVLANRRENS